MDPIVLAEVFKDDKLTMEHLAEEASEVAQAKSKVFRFGLNDRWPEGGTKNVTKLEEELGHLFAVVDVLVARGIISMENIESNKQSKWESMVRWNAYPGTKGMKGELE